MVKSEKEKRLPGLQKLKEIFGDAQIATHDGIAYIGSDAIQKLLINSHQPADTSPEDMIEAIQHYYTDIQHGAGSLGFDITETLRARLPEEVRVIHPAIALNLEACDKEAGFRVLSQLENGINMMLANYRNPAADELSVAETAIILDEISKTDIDRKELLEKITGVEWVSNEKDGEVIYPSRMKN